MDSNVIAGYDLILSYDESKLIVEEQGWQTFFQKVFDLYPERNFFSCSQEWLENRKFICKFKGRNGDLIIGWADTQHN